MTAKQFFQLFLIILVLIFFVWLAFYFLVAALVIGACVTAFFAIRKFLIQKGILNRSSPDSNAGEAASGWEEDPSTGVIEVEYHEVRRDPPPQDSTKQDTPRQD